MGHTGGLALPASLGLRILNCEMVAQCGTLGHVDRLLSSLTWLLQALTLIAAALTL